jgi:hypothetical protein
MRKNTNRTILFVLLMSHWPTLLFSRNNLTTSYQTNNIFLSDEISTNDQPNEQAMVL